MTRVRTRWDAFRSSTVYLHFWGVSDWIAHSNEMVCTLVTEKNMLTKLRENTLEYICRSTEGNMLEYAKEREREKHMRGTP